MTETSQLVLRQVLWPMSSQKPIRRSTCSCKPGGSFFGSILVIVLPKFVGKQIGGKKTQLAKAQFDWPTPAVTAKKLEEGLAQLWHAAV